MLKKLPRKIFLSHCEKDYSIIKIFAEDLLVNGMSFHPNDYFCSSIPGSRITLGANWAEDILFNLEGCKVIILFITPNFMSSEMCLMEMVGAWIGKNETIPPIIDPIDYKTAGPITDQKQIEHLDDEEGLDRVRDRLVNEIFTDMQFVNKSDRWSSKKKEVLAGIKKHINNNPFATPIDPVEIKNFVAEKGALKTKIDSLQKQLEHFKKSIKHYPN